MMRRRPRPFISYAHEDQPAAIQFYGDLRAMGAQPWLDAADLLPGQDWELAIRDALRTATHFVALISRRSVNKRGFVQKEVKQALDMLEEFPPSEIFVIPVRLERIELPYGQLQKLQRVDLFDDRTTALEKIAKSLGLDASKTFRQDSQSVAKNLSRATQAHRIAAASRWVGISVNDLLPDYDKVGPKLTEASIDVTYLFSARGVQAPPPVYSVIVAHSKVGITMLRHVCEAVAGVGNWYVQIWDEGISESWISVGAYGYGGAPAASLDPALLLQLKKRSFTMSKLREWIATRGIALTADYPLKD